MHAFVSACRRTHLQVVEGPLLQLSIHWHQGLVVSSPCPGGRVHLPGLAHRHGRPCASLQGVSVVPVMSLPFISSQGHCGAGHALPRPGRTDTLLGPLHGQLLDGCVQALVANGIPPSAPADQEAAVAVQVVVRAPPARRPAAVAPARLVPRVSALATLPGLVPPGRARLMARVVAPAVLPSTPVPSPSLATVVPAASCAVVLPLGRRLKGMRLGKEALDGVDQVANA